MASQNRVGVLLFVLVVSVFAYAWFKHWDWGIPNESVPGALERVHQVWTCLESYKQITGNYPTTEQGLEALVSKPTTPPIPDKWQQICDTVPTDDWCARFVYRCPGLDHPDRYDLICLGVDGVRSKDGVEVP